MSEKYPNAFSRPDEEMDAIYTDGEHLSHMVNAEKIVARWADKVIDMSISLTTPASPENWEEEDRNPVYTDFREAA